jgi:hypothetical protein
MELDDLAAAVGGHEDLAAFVRALESDLVANPQHWENRTLDDFLNALWRFVGSLESWARNNNEPVPVELTWRLVAEMLLVAREYE